IPPFVFDESTTPAVANLGDYWDMEGVRDALGRGDEHIRVHLPGGQAITVLARFSPRERAVLLAGGLIAWLRAGGARPLSTRRGHSAAADQGPPITTPVPDDRVA